MSKDSMNDPFSADPSEWELSMLGYDGGADLFPEIDPTNADVTFDSLNTDDSLNVGPSQVLSLEAGGVPLQDSLGGIGIYGQTNDVGDALNAGDLFAQLELGGGDVGSVFALDSGISSDSVGDGGVDRTLIDTIAMHGEGGLTEALDTEMGNTLGVPHVLALPSILPVIPTSTISQPGLLDTNQEVSVLPAHLSAHEELSSIAVALQWSSKNVLAISIPPMITEISFNGLTPCYRGHSSLSGDQETKRKRKRRSLDSVSSVSHSDCKIQLPPPTGANASTRLFLLRPALLSTPGFLAALPMIDDISSALSPVKLLRWNDAGSLLAGLSGTGIITLWSTEDMMNSMQIIGSWQSPEIVLDLLWLYSAREWHSDTPSSESLRANSIRRKSSVGPHSTFPTLAVLTSNSSVRFLSLTPDGIIEASSTKLAVNDSYACLHGSLRLSTVERTLVAALEESYGGEIGLSMWTISGDVDTTGRLECRRMSPLLPLSHINPSGPQMYTLKLASRDRLLLCTSIPTPDNTDLHSRIALYCLLDEMDDFPDKGEMVEAIAVEGGQSGKRWWCQGEARSLGISTVTELLNGGSSIAFGVTTEFFDVVDLDTLPAEFSSASQKALLAKGWYSVGAAESPNGMQLATLLLPSTGARAAGRLHIVSALGWHKRESPESPELQSMALGKQLAVSILNTRDPDDVLLTVSSCVANFRKIMPDFHERVLETMNSSIYSAATESKEGTSSFEQTKKSQPGYSIPFICHGWERSMVGVHGALFRSLDLDVQSGITSVVLKLLSLLDGFDSAFVHSVQANALLYEALNRGSLPSTWIPLIDIQRETFRELAMNSTWVSELMRFLHWNLYTTSNLRQNTTASNNSSNLDDLGIPQQAASDYPFTRNSTWLLLLFSRPIRRILLRVLLGVFALKLNVERLGSTTPNTPESRIPTEHSAIASQSILILSKFDGLIDDISFVYSVEQLEATTGTSGDDLLADFPRCTLPKVTRIFWDQVRKLHNDYVQKLFQVSVDTTKTFFFRPGLEVGALTMYPSAYHDPSCVMAASNNTSNGSGTFRNTLHHVAFIPLNNYLSGWTDIVTNGPLQFASSVKCCLRCRNSTVILANDSNEGPYPSLEYARGCICGGIWGLRHVDRA
ncbi:hypothetical protein M427DRAFT_183835 [Gonapodya prolifera JEL478]|uniref:Mediator complex subunit 16 n=1 Tax=Gonapodya prolifera (strain JEL478) TaxID=1344416 RepID=A0A139A101_GONPJ|nr:hypothetical protein M427DRAFT_183835 [Gonapodya prolifera JEL478]|eukprot:KXS10298.1 hypothetical protein M427DRAFT_183835 [Gonapodya prolifera JEL478]